MYELVCSRIDRILSLIGRRRTDFEEGPNTFNHYGRGLQWNVQQSAADRRPQCVNVPRCYSI